MTTPEGYRFDPKFDWWTKDHIANYGFIKNYFFGGCGLSEPVSPVPLCFVEIGVFEGRSTVWFVENVLSHFPGSVYKCVEPDPAPNFEHNIELLRERVPGVNILHHREYSEHFLPKAIDTASRPSLFYLDGDHNAPGVLRDAVMAWECLGEGGVMLFDDYEMEATDPWHYISHKEFKTHPRANFRHPSHAIDAFLNVYRGLYDRVIDNFQVGIVKRVELGAKNIDHGDETQGSNGKGKFEYYAK